MSLCPVNINCGSERTLTVVAVFTCLKTDTPRWFAASN